MSVWVKICGITRLQDARAAFDAGADAIGINFWPRSKRYCEPRRAREIVAALAPRRLVYGVFAGATRAEIEAVVAEVGLGGVQLHGGEAPNAAQGWSLPVIRAVGASSRAAVVEALDDARAASRSARESYRLLLDNPSGGGSGCLVDASVVEGLDLASTIVAGGLTPDNVSAIVARLAPFGVDTAGGVEAAAGIKDARLIEEFIVNARSARR
ncbi:MAG: phosphoribosylanthranilate isomerase [Deltaproteobacteria bacterium]|nr:phosphoribosylanthranilate isomerase [Deltaproteobacteria bacterium]